MLGAGEPPRPGVTTTASHGGVGVVCWCIVLFGAEITDSCEEYREPQEAEKQQRQQEGQEYMIALIQRVLSASVVVKGETVGKIGSGLLVLLGVEQGDNEQKADRLCERVLGYRIFGDENDKMNLNVQQAGGSVLVVSQFTLVADTQKGMRPSFSRGAVPLEAASLYQHFVGQCREHGIEIQTGVFAADMQVALVNDGPVTFWLQV